MRTLVFLFIYLSKLNGGLAQYEFFLDSLKADIGNTIIVFEENCSGCIRMNPPCKEYTNNGNSTETYILWRNEHGFHVKRWNSCGSSTTISFLRWKKNPFDFTEQNVVKIDTTKLRYPLTFNHQDSIWEEVAINHYWYYHFIFVSYPIQDIIIRETAFRKTKKEDEIKAETDSEFAKNQSRYAFNNESEIKGLLDIIQNLLMKKKNKLNITYKN